MRQRSALLGTIGIVLSGFLLATCAPENSVPPTPIAPATEVDAGAQTNVAAITPVTITFAASQEEFPLFTPLIASFQADNPGIDVQLVDSNQAATTSTLANGDVITTLGPESLRTIVSLADTAVGIGPTREAIAKGWLRDLSPLIDADTTFDRADFYPRTLTPEPDGKIFVLPAKQYLDLLAYNKTLWANQGLPPPQPGWGWNDLKAAAQQLARKRGTTIEMYGMVDWGSGLPALQAELREAGYQHDLAEPMRLDDPALVAALERVVALAQSGAYRSGNNFRQNILNQQVGIWPATPNMLATENGSAAAPPSFAVGLLPRPGTASSVTGYIMSAGTLHPNEAWRWLAYLSHQVIAEPFANANPVGVIPARRSVAELSGYWQRLDSDTATAIRAVLDHPPPPPAFPDVAPAAEGPLRAALDAALAGRLSPTVALQQAQSELERWLAAAPPTPQPMSNQIVVATPAPIAPAGAVSIRFGVPGASTVFDAIAQTFNQNHPNIFVQVVHTDLGLGRTASIGELAHQTDCFAAAALPGERDSAQLLDLRPFIDADPGFHLDDYPPAILERFQHNTNILGVPDGLEFRVLNFNQDMFDANKVAYPNASWTLNDLARAAHQLTQKQGSTAHYGFASTFLQARDIFFVLERLGVSATTGTGANTQPDFTNPQVVQAIRFYLDLLRDTSPHDHLGGYQRGDFSNNAIAALVHSGQVGMWFDFGSNSAGSTTISNFTHAIAAPPFGQNPPTSADIRVSGLYISAATPQPEACWNWLQTLSRETAHLQGAVPARRSLATADTFLAQAAPGTAEIYQAYRPALQQPADNTQPNPAIDYYWFFRAIDRAMQGGASERELASAQALTTQFLACRRGGGDANTCTAQIDPTYQGWGFAAP